MQTSDARARPRPSTRRRPSLRPRRRPALPTHSAAGTKSNCKYYIIQSGDTLETIALSLGLNPLDLQEVNPDGAQLQVNQFVKLTGW